MKIYAADSKQQHAKVVFDGDKYTTVAVPSEAGQYVCECKDEDLKSPKSSAHPKVTPNHHQARCWSCGLSSCLIFSVVASVGLFVLLYSAARPVPIEESLSFGECELPILPDERQPEGYKEHITADDKAMTETFDLPEINANHPATIMHDFYNEITVYLDRLEGVCFVMKLNITQVVPPKYLLEAFIRYKRGEFAVDMNTIKETMELQTPPIDDLSPLGIMTEMFCQDLPSYWLVKPGTPALRKRSVSSKRYHVTYFNGQHMIDLTVTSGSI